MSKLLIVLCAFVVLTLTPSVKADPIVVTSGSLSVTGISGGPHFSLFGENFSAFGGGEPGSTQATQCFPCVSGNVIGLNGFYAGGATLGFGGGVVTVGFTTFTNLVYAGTLCSPRPPSYLLLQRTLQSPLRLRLPVTFAGVYFRVVRQTVVRVTPSSAPS
jgi:hypothetical protein